MEVGTNNCLKQTSKIILKLIFHILKETGTLHTKKEISYLLDSATFAVVKVIISKLMSNQKVTKCISN